MSITGWNSNIQVTVHGTCQNGHVVQYQCKAMDLAFLCNMLEAECGRGLLRHYAVSQNGEMQMQNYFGFTDQYPNWMLGTPERRASSLETA